jgi:hypothetical protein
MRYVPCLFALVLLSGCSREPTWDATSDETEEASSQKILASLDPGGQMVFGACMNDIYGCESMLDYSNPGETHAQAKARYKKASKSIHGMTAQQIMTRAHELARERYKRELAAEAKAR